VHPANYTQRVGVSPTSNGLRTELSTDSGDGLGGKKVDFVTGELKRGENALWREET